MRSKWQSFVISLLLLFEMHSRIIWSSSIITTSTSILQVICIFWESIGQTWPSTTAYFWKFPSLLPCWGKFPAESSAIVSDYSPRVWALGLCWPQHMMREHWLLLTVIRESIETDMVELTLRAKRKTSFILQKTGNRLQRNSGCALMYGLGAILYMEKHCKDNVHPTLLCTWLEVLHF